MSQEVNPSSYEPKLTDLSVFIGQSISSHSEEMVINPLGAILYRKGQNLVVLGENDEGKLCSSDVSTPDGFDKNALFGWKGRLQDFSHLDDVVVSQVGLDRVSVYTHRSIRTQPSVSLRIPYSNPLTKKHELFITDEESLLKVFTGESGGLAIFEGANRPEEIALVMEQDAAEKRFGLVFFFHPQESDLGIDSVTGLYTFLDDLNCQFEEQSNFLLQNRVLDELEVQLISGGIKFNSEVREQLFRTQLIAYSRLAERTRDEKYKKTLTTLLPSLIKQGVVSRIMQSIGMKDTLIPDEAFFEKSVDAMILGGSKPTLEQKKHESNEDKDIWKTLDSIELADLRISIGEYYGGRNEVMDSYMSILAKKLANAKNKREFDDLRALLTEIKGTQYSTLRKRWIVYTDHGGSGSIIPGNYEERSIDVIIDQMLLNLIERRNRELFK